MNLVSLMIPSRKRVKSLLRTLLLFCGLLMGGGLAQDFLTVTNNSSLDIGVRAHRLLMPEQVRMVYFETKGQPTNMPGVFFIRWETNYVGKNIIDRFPVACVSWGGMTNEIYLGAYRVNFPTNTVDAMCRSGLICNTRGHSWKPHMHLTADYVPNRKACRICNICGQHQDLFEDWK